MGSLPKLSVIKGPTKLFKPILIHKLFEEIATTSASDKIALIYEDVGVIKKYTYKQLNEITNRLAKVISKLVSKKDLKANKDGDFIIGVCMNPTDHLVITLLSVLKAGAAYLPIDPSFPDFRIEHILQQTKPFLIIYENDSKSFLKTEKLSFDELQKYSKNLNSASLNDNETLKNQHDNVAIVLCTSGSTGTPKGVRLSHEAIFNRLNWQFDTFPYSSTENTGIFKTIFTFVDSVPELWGPLIKGMSIIVAPKGTTNDPEKLFSILEKYKIERLILVPSLLQMILMHQKVQKNISLINLKTWICSGEVLTISLAQKFFKYFSGNDVKLCNFYGSTEITDVTYHVISNPDELKNLNKIPIGVPIDNTIIYMLDQEYRPVKLGDVGEIYVSGLNLASGYVNGNEFMDNPFAIEPTFSKLYKTGDFGKIENGTIIYEGRTDLQIKIRGQRVDLSEVEKAVNTIEGVNKGVVLCYKPGEINQTIVAFVTTNAHVNRNQIKNSLCKKLIPYMVPQVVIKETIPLLINGKIDRQALLSSYENTNKNELNYEVDINYNGVSESKRDAAIVLFETVASVLNKSVRSTISIAANFYEIGGNSLNTIYTITMLKEQGYHISVADFLTSNNLGEVLECMFPEKNNIVSNLPEYTSKFIINEDKQEVYNIISNSFCNKADRWMTPEICNKDYEKILDYMWELLVETKLSFVIKNEAGKIVGASLNFDGVTEPVNVPFKSKLLVIFEYLETLEAPIRDNILPKGKGKVFHSFLMGTRCNLSPKENVMIMQIMEEEILRIAKEKGFEGVFASNTSPLTQQLDSDFYGYETLMDHQVNTFITADNTKPFKLAPDNLRCKIQWKSLR